MYTIGLALTLRPGKYDAIQTGPRRVVARIGRRNARQRCEHGDLSRRRSPVRFAAAPSEAHWHRSRQDPILAKWDKSMHEFLETDEAGNLAFTLLPKGVRVRRIQIMMNFEQDS